MTKRRLVYEAVFSNQQEYHLLDIAVRSSASATKPSERACETQNLKTTANGAEKR
jgi:hypothetical protein